MNQLISNDWQSDAREISSGVDPPTVEGSKFDLRGLPHFPHLFSESDLAQLARWGVHAYALSRGTVEARSEKESLFVQVVAGQRPPTTHFHRIWLMYTQAVAAEEAFEAASHLRNQVHQATLQAEALGEDVSRLNTAHRSAWKLVEQAESRLKTATEQHRRTTAELRARIKEYEEKLGIVAEPSSVMISSDDSNSREGWGNDWREQK